MKRFFVLLLFILFLSSCSFWRPNTEEYCQSYAHLKRKPFYQRTMTPSPYFLIVLVNARHLDYTDNFSFFKTLTKHPNDYSKNGDVGHAWIYLHGYHNGVEIAIEGGHSGELGVTQPRYFDGVMDLIARGDANPVRYLWETLHDGFFQSGAGGHTPNYAAKIDLTECQFHTLLEFINTYDFTEYALVGRQCSTFVSEVAALAGWNLECHVTIPIRQTLKINKACLALWQDSFYSSITISTPDILEKSLIESVNSGYAEHALAWYLGKHRKPVSLRESARTLMLFPSRFHRWLSI